MIVANEREKALECTVCGELDGVSAHAFENDSLLALLMARMKKDHADCEQWVKDPARARAERRYKQRMRAEMRGIGA